MFLSTSKKTDVILCSATFYLYRNEKYDTFKAAVPNLFGTRDPVSWNTVFPPTGWRGTGSGGSARDGEWQMKLRSLARRSSPAVQPAP